jgi:hypothetical protein
MGLADGHKPRVLHFFSRRAGRAYQRLPSKKDRRRVWEQAKRRLEYTRSVQIWTDRPSTAFFALNRPRGGVRRAVCQASRRRE